VSTLYVLRSAQRLGLGRRLLGAAARVLQANGADALTLWVLDGNRPARAFYERLGGVETAQRPVRGWGGGLRESAFRWDDIASLSGQG
jgi:ribosomal protein S18 acetylase RimI-like enzyme